MMKIGLDLGDAVGARAARRRQLERAAGLLDDVLGPMAIDVDWEAIGRFAAQMEAGRRASLREIELSNGEKTLVCEQRPDLLAILDYVTGYRP